MWQHQNQQKTIWLLSPREELDIDCRPVALFVDNTGSLELAKNSRSYDRTKPIRLRHHFIRECVADKSIELSFTPSHLEVADALTKPVPGQVLDYFCNEVKERKKMGFPAFVQRPDCGKNSIYILNHC